MAAAVQRKLVQRVSETVVTCEADTVEAEELRDETWLLRVASSNFERFAGIAESNIYPSRRSLTWGSLCSGSEGAAFVMRAISAALRESRQPLQLTQIFSYEINREKRSWISGVVECEERVMRRLEQALLQQQFLAGRRPGKAATAATQGGAPGEPEAAAGSAREDHKDADGNVDAAAQFVDQLAAAEDSEEDSDSAAASSEKDEKPCQKDVADIPCLFTDICDMANDMATCSCHGSKCFTPSVDILVVGTSYKDLSKANPNKRKDSEQATFTQAHSRGGSAQTYHGLVAYLRKKRPPLVVFENVDTLDEGSQSGMSNQHILMEQLGQLGYEGQATICEASKFGLSFRRRRCYIFFVQVAANPLIDFNIRSAQTCFQQFRQFLSSCMREGPSLETQLLAPDHPAVLAELQSREDKKKAEDPTPGAASSAQWPEQHMKFAAERGVLWCQKAPEHLRNNAWYHTLTSREKNALPLLQHQHSSESAMIRDLSQSIYRANSVTRLEHRHVGPTLLSRQTLWAEPRLFGREARVLLGREALRFQGFPVMCFLEELAVWKEQQESERSKGTLSGNNAANRTRSGSQETLPAGFPSENLMWDLAGNGMSLPVLMGVVQSAISCLPWRTSEAQMRLAQQDDVRVACEAVALLDSDVQVAAKTAEAPSGLLKRRRLQK